MKYKCCDVVFWKHEDGWDLYRKGSCDFYNGKWIPRWYDDFIVEDCPTKEIAKKELAERHVLGICLVN